MAGPGGDLAKTPSYERQNTEDVADLPLKIPVSIACLVLACLLCAGRERRVLIRAHLPQVSAVYEHFQCPICMSRIEEACLTPCGHRYCYKCIDECINRRWVWHEYLYHIYIMEVYPY